MKYSDFTRELKDALIGTSRVWIEIPAKFGNKKYFNVFIGTIITVFLDNEGNVIKVE